MRPRRRWPPWTAQPSVAEISRSRWPKTDRGAPVVDRVAPIAVADPLAVVVPVAVVQDRVAVPVAVAILDVVRVGQGLVVLAMVVADAAGIAAAAAPEGLPQAHGRPRRPMKTRGARTGCDDATRPTGRRRSAATKKAIPVCEIPAVASPVVVVAASASHGKKTTGRTGSGCDAHLRVSHLAKGPVGQALDG